MQTSAQHRARAIRIRRLLDRIDIRIRNLRFAESLAYSGAQQALLDGKRSTAGTAHSIASALIGAIVLDALPTPYRDWALNAGLILEAGCVANNVRLGIGVRF